MKEGAAGQEACKDNVGRIEGKEDPGEKVESEKRLDRSERLNQASGQASEKNQEGMAKADSHPWQAVWDPTRQAWYFWNFVTNETTWTNPFEKLAESGRANGRNVPTDDKETKLESDEMNTIISEPISMTDEEVAKANGIDPDLAYLDPVLYASEVQQARSGSAVYRAAGAFDSRTGKFIPSSATGQGGLHDPSRLSHANQADRQMGAFFDVEAYEEQRKRSREERERDEAESGKRKKMPSKKELQRFKERAKQKKSAKYAWLRD